MSIITCYNRTRPVHSDSGMCLVEVLSLYGQTIANYCAIPFDYCKNWVTMDAVDVESTADRIVEVYHYGNGYVSCMDRTREYLGTFVAGIPSAQCVPTICVYDAQIGSLNVWCDPAECTCNRDSLSKGGSGDDYKYDEGEEYEKKSIGEINIDWSDETEKDTSGEGDDTDTDTKK